jgi:Pro-kumamolisin, activation domain
MCLSQASTYLDQEQLPFSSSNLGLDQKYPATLSQSSFSDIYMKSHRAQSDEVLDIVFVMHRGNLGEVPSFQSDVSNPSDSGLTVSLLRKNLESARDNLESSGGAVSYLTLNGATITSDWQNSEFVTARAPMRVWEKMFHCEFYSFLRNDNNGNDIKVTRTEKYRIPEELIEHVKSVFSTVRELPTTPSMVIGGLQTFLSPILMVDDYLSDRRTKSRSPNMAPTPSVSSGNDESETPVDKPPSDKKPDDKPRSDEKEDITEFPVSSPSIISSPRPSRSPICKQIISQLNHVEVDPIITSNYNNAIS